MAGSSCGGRAIPPRVFSRVARAHPWATRTQPANIRDPASGLVQVEKGKTKAKTIARGLGLKVQIKKKGAPLNTPPVRTPRKRTAKLRFLVQSSIVLFARCLRFRRWRRYGVRFHISVASFLAAIFVCCLCFLLYVMRLCFPFMSVRRGVCFCLACPVLSCCGTCHPSIMFCYRVLQGGDHFKVDAERWKGVLGSGLFNGAQLSGTLRHGGRTPKTVM